ncbi:MAG TPA: glycosyltransferase [Opitutaceae bacterium]|nr:glycosyltransferase [Opitutaceae bacterium]
MASFQRTPPFGGAFARRFTRYSGLFFDEFAADSAWIREDAVVRLPPMSGVDALIVRGEFRAHPEARGPEAGFPRLEVLLDGRSLQTVSARETGPWEARIALDPESARAGSVLYFRLHGVGFTNALAWLGRVTRLGPLQRYRAQNRNRQLRIWAIESESGERVYDFSKREGPYCAAFARAHTRAGMNIVGFFTADLGIGESARCMARAADAASIQTALVPLKLNCKNRLGDSTFSARLQDSNPFEVNVIHLDPPAARDIDHHHGAAFRAGKYNIGYFAWELPEYPDAWTPAFDFFDEIWCPSDFVRESIAHKAPFPVLTMPHSISFERPVEDSDALRARLGVPRGPFLFLCLFDLNSYTARKNPRAVVEAFRMSGLARGTAALVIKVQNADANASDYAALVDSVRDIPGTVIIKHTLSRADVYALESACDCFVSLHRSEGFGLAVAECMYLGKPVIATDWSATSEYLNAGNGLPVRYSLVELQESHGPYSKGSTWAEPDIGHAAQLMREIASSPAQASNIGSAARRTIEERFSPTVIGALYRRRLEAIASL